MVTVTPFMGKLKVHIRQFYINENGEIKPGRNGITMEIEEFDELVKLILQVKKSIERYELKDTGIPLSPFKLDLPVLDLDTVFLLIISTITRAYSNHSRRETFGQSTQISFITIVPSRFTTTGRPFP